MKTASNIKRASKDKTINRFHVNAVNDIKEQLLNDIVGVWLTASLSILSSHRIVAKLKDVAEKYDNELKRGKSNVYKEWLQCLFDISTCQCYIPENFVIHH